MGDQGKVTLDLNWWLPWLPWMTGYMFFLGAGGKDTIENVGDFIISLIYWPMKLGEIIFP